MAIDARIALAGQQPNFLNTISQANQAAAFQNESVASNQLRNFLRESGDQVYAGNEQALGQYAQFSPEQALGVRNTRDQMSERQERLKLARAAAARAAAGHASSMDARQAAAQAEALERAVAGGMQAQTPEQWDAFVSQRAPDLVGQFENRDMIAAQYLGAADAFKMANPAAEGPADEYQRYVQEEQNAGRQPLDRIAYAQAKKGSGFSVTTTDGTVVQYGGGNQLPETTEGEKGSAGYLSRMRASEALLDGLSVDEPAVRSITSLLVGGTNFEGIALNERQGKILQAQRDWVRAKLRKESGAVIGADEMAEEIRTYFPLPGEGPELVAQKREARKAAERQFEIMSGNAAPQAELQGGTGADALTFEQFSSDPSAQSAAARYGVTLEEMWEIQQESQ